MSRSMIVGKATNDNLQEKYAENAIPEMNDDNCIKNIGTWTRELHKSFKFMFDKLK